MSCRFGAFTLDPDPRLLTRGPRKIHLSPKAFDLLALLAAKRPNVVTKADLIEELWPGTFVVEANLSNLIAEIRTALNDRARTPKFIRTVHGLGYAFCSDATDAPAASRPRSPHVTGWIEWGKQRFPLSIGEHVVGRDADVDVTLDSSTVSRRHARVVVDRDRTMLDDLGSKNGTYVGTERVTAPVRLRDGDAVRIGSVQVTYRARTARNTTETVAVG